MKLFDCLSLNYLVINSILVSLKSYGVQRQSEKAELDRDMDSYWNNEDNKMETGEVRSNIVAGQIKISS